MKASSVKGEGDVDHDFFLGGGGYGGVLHHEFSPRGHNVNKQYYLEVMKCLQEAVKGKRTNSRGGEGCFTITMLLHILSPRITRDLLIKTRQTCPTTSVITKSPTNRFLLVTKAEIRTERSNIESDDNIQENLQMKVCDFPQNHSRNAPKSRENTGSSVLGVQGHTLKETRPNNP